MGGYAAAFLLKWSLSSLEEQSGEVTVVQQIHRQLCALHGGESAGRAMETCVIRTLCPGSGWLALACPRRSLVVIWVLGRFLDFALGAVLGP